MLLVKPFHGFNDDAQTALAASPEYFMTWYTVKSVGLVTALVVGAYLLDRASGHISAKRVCQKETDKCRIQNAMVTPARQKENEKWLSEKTLVQPKKFTKLEPVDAFNWYDVN